MIRYAHLTDVPRIVALAREEHAMSSMRGIAFDATFTSEVAHGFVSLVGRTLLISDGGYLAGMVQPLGFTERKIALEFAWYANDGSGFELLRAFEVWAKRMGAVKVVAHDMQMRESRLQRALVRKGYSLMSTAMVKDI